MLSACLLTLMTVLPVQAEQRSPAELLDVIRARGNEVPLKVFDELARHKSAEALEALIQGLGAVSKVDKLCGAYKAFAHFKGVAEVEDEAAEYLAECAMKNQEQLALHAAYRLGALWPAAQDELVVLALEHRTHDGRSAALLHLVDHGMPLTEKQLKQLARSKDPAVRYEGLLAQTAQLEDSSQRTKALLELERSKKPIERLVAVELLATADPPERFERLTERLSDDDGRVARKAVASLERTRDRRAVAILITHLSVAGEGARFRCSRALERLTGKSLGSGPDRWQRWWEAEGASFEVPDTPAKSPAAAEREQATSSFYGLAIHAEDLVFAIDTSDSMKQAAGDESRITAAKRELTKAIEGLPEESSFDIVNFGKRAWSWKGELVPAKARAKREARKHIEYLELSWGTEIYRALREAFRDPRTDTIVFMTDGDPQLSLMQDRVALRRIVAQWNRTRHTTIDCLSIGTDRTWLRKLAEQSGGRYLGIE